MKSETLFIAERAAALHCPELLGKAAAPRDAVMVTQPVMVRFSRLFGACLAALCGGEAPSVTVKPLRLASSDDFRTNLAALAAHCVLVTGTPDNPLLATIDGAAILRMIDRTFGGRGEVPSVLPEALPPSADLLVSRLAGLIAEQLSVALGSAGTVLVRSQGSDLTDLYPFAAATELILAEFEIMEGLRTPWMVRLLLPASLAATLGGDPPTHRSSPTPRPQSSPGSEPFGSVPVTLSAMLVDMRMPLSAIAGLAPGQVIPVAIARQVPLRIGERTVATGTVGSKDDCVALQLTTLS